MATPTTLIGLLWATHYGWREERIAESAREIAESARELHRRLGRFVEPLAKIGKQLDSAVSSYNKAVGSFERGVIPQVRRIEAAGAHSSEREVNPPAIIEVTARPVIAQLEPETLEASEPPLASDAQPEVQPEMPALPSEPVAVGAQAPR
jgi:DNA recombination protein RmuC